MQSGSAADQRSPLAHDAAGAMPSFGVVLKRYRQESGLTQEALAERAGLSARGIQDLERGVTRPLRDTTQRLLAALPLSPGERARFEAVAAPAPRRRVRAPTQEGEGRSPPQSAPVAARYLPSWPTSLVGRERDEAAVTHMLLHGGVRLLTLTGPGGVGKTRLAVRVAETIGDAFPGGAAFVTLAPIADPALVLPSMARSLGLREVDGRALPDALCEHVCDLRLLMLLDNFEHVAGAAPALAELLCVCPNLHLLVTSREALRIQGEQEYAVPSLDLPTVEDLPVIEQLAHYASVALFVQRARAVKPGFALTAKNAPVVAAICRRLDGLPLAIEIAVARTRVLSPQELLARLDLEGGRSLLRLLTGGAQDLPLRQQTARDTVAWSYALLDDAEQRVFRCLSAFRGGWTLDAAEAVGAPEVGTAIDVLDHLTSLVSKSLAESREDAHGGTRFRYLEIVREYGLECLEASGEAHAARSRHAAYYRALVQRLEPALKGPDQAAALGQFERELENVRVALRWACDSGEVELGLQIAGALWRVWEIRGYFSEGRRWFADLLARAERSEQSVAPAVRAQALVGAGVLAYRQSDYAHATAVLEEGLALWRAAGDAGGMAIALNMLGNVAMALGDPGRAEELYLESLALRQPLGDRWGIAATLSNLGIVAEARHDHARAVAWYEESLLLRREIGDASGIAGTLGNLGAALRDHGDYDRAKAYFNEGLALQRALGDRRGIAVLLNHAGALACLQVRYEDANAQLREGLTLSWEMGDPMRVAAFVSTLGSLALREQRPERATRLLAAAQTMQNAIHVSLTPADSDDQARDSAHLRTRLGDDAFRAHWTIGASWSMERAVVEALANE